MKTWKSENYQAAQRHYRRTKAAAEKALEVALMRPVTWQDLRVFDAAAEAQQLAALRLHASENILRETENV